MEIQKQNQAAGKGMGAAMASTIDDEPAGERSATGLEKSLPNLTGAFLDKLLRLQLLSINAVEGFLEQHQERLSTYADANTLGKALIADGLLTQYQIERLLAGTSHGLVLGNHRVLGRLGAGAMGVVYRAEHMFMKRPEAVKVLPVDDGCPPHVLSRFYSEMRVLAELHHPNIVMAYDAGRVASPGSGQPSLLYLAMELVDGGDLENYVLEHGPAPIDLACDWMQQAADGLQEAHDHNLIHRDIKPSNILIGNQGEVKLVDFGLVQQFNMRQTERGTLLGTVDFMAPEQSEDASSVGSSADIYGLGASLFYLLTGEAPYPQARSVYLALRNLQIHPPRLLRTLRPEAPPELEALVSTLLSREPTQRPALPMTVSRALAPFARSAKSTAAPGRNENQKPTFLPTNVPVP